MSKTITSHSGTQVGKLTIWVRAFGMKNGSRVQQSYYFSQNSLASLYDGSLRFKSPKANTFTGGVNWDNLACFVQNSKKELTRMKLVIVRKLRDWKKHSHSKMYIRLLRFSKVDLCAIWSPSCTYTVRKCWGVTELLQIKYDKPSKRHCLVQLSLPSLSHIKS